MHTLLQFALEKRRLQVHTIHVSLLLPLPSPTLPPLHQVGGQLLPDLVEFYQWLHTHLAHQVTHHRACNTFTIGQVVALASRRMPHNMADQIQQLYQRVKGEFSGLGLVVKLSVCLPVCQFVCLSV